MYLKSEFHAPVGDATAFLTAIEWRRGELLIKKSMIRSYQAEAHWGGPLL